MSAVRISKTSKLGCLSWSLQALDTCPGSKSTTGGLVPACSGCYATTGNYRYPNVIAPREHNRTDWERDDWADDMVAALAKETHFRWFDSGDMFSVKLARKMLDVMRRTPWCKHWLPTRMHKFSKFQAIIRDMQSLFNVMVRPSSDDIDGTYTAGIHGSTIIPNADDAPTGVTVCGAYSREGKCGPCRACWDKTVAVIAYPAHGQKMAKVIRLALAA
jgi:Gene product 88